MAIHAHSTPASRVPRARRPKHDETSRPQPLPGIPFRDLASIPPVYAMRLSGDCLAPDLNEGDIVQFARDEEVKAGDFAIFVLRPELVQPGGLQCMIKRLVMNVPPYVKLPFRENPKSDVHALVIAEQTNPRRQYMIRCESLLAVHKFIGTCATVARQ